MTAYYVVAAWLALQLPVGMKLGKWIKNGGLCEA